MKHLLPEERHTIHKMKQQGHSQRSIAKTIGRWSSTISRELKRNALADGDYSPLFAQKYAQERARGKPHYQAINAENQPIIEAGLKEKLSPEQIFGRAEQQQIPLKMPCIATIYRHVYADRKDGGKLYRQLRHQGHRRKNTVGASSNAPLFPIGSTSVNALPKWKNASDWETSNAI